MSNQVVQGLSSILSQMEDSDKPTQSLGQLSEHQPTQSHRKGSYLPTIESIGGSSQSKSPEHPIFTRQSSPKKAKKVKKKKNKAKLNTLHNLVDIVACLDEVIEESKLLIDINKWVLVD